MFHAFADEEPAPIHNDASTIRPRRAMSPASQIAVFGGIRIDWQPAAEHRLKELMHLPLGWDGHQGKPTEPNVAYYAYLLLEALLRRRGVPLGWISPLPYGGLVLEWHRKGWDIEIEISAPEDLHVYMHELASGTEEQFHLRNRLDRLKDVIARIAD